MSGPPLARAVKDSLSKKAELANQRSLSALDIDDLDDHRSRNHSLKYSRGALHGPVNLVHFDEISLQQHHHPQPLLHHQEQHKLPQPQQYIQQQQQLNTLHQHHQQAPHHQMKHTPKVHHDHLHPQVPQVTSQQQQDLLSNKASMQAQQLQATNCGNKSPGTNAIKLILYCHRTLRFILIICDLRCPISFYNLPPKCSKFALINSLSI